MRECGTVVHVDDMRVDVEIAPSEACAGCGACSSASGEKRLLEGVFASISLSVGDVVELEIPQRGRWRAQVLVFVLPVTVLVLGYLAGFLLFSQLGANPDTGGAVIGIAAGVLSLVSLRVIGRSASYDRYEPQVRDIISRGSTRRFGESSPDRLAPPYRGGNNS